VDVSFGTVWEAFARALPDATAISEPGRDYSYAEFEDRSARLAAALADAGVGPGDKVACYLYNGAAYLETVFAAFKLGAVPVNVNYRYTSEELFALLADADAAAMVFSAELAGNVTDVAARLPSLRLLVKVGAGAVGPDAAELGELLAAHAPRPALPRPGSDELFMYTGGTTGKPKGVIWRLSDLMHSMEVSVFQRLGVTALPGTLDEAVRVAATARSAGRSPVMMPAVPLMHATGLFNSMGALLAGGRVVTARPGRLDPRHVWETVAAQRVRTLVVAGNAVCQPLVDELFAAERAGRPHDLSSLDSVVSSGTVLSDRLKRALHERASVTITDATVGSTIYYALHGVTPTTKSSVYTGALTVPSTETIKAIAVAPGYSPSSLAAATYTIVELTATPHFSLPAGTYKSPQTVKMSDATPHAKIYYTLDGSTPTTESDIYVGQTFKITKNTTIKARARAYPDSLSKIATAVYTIE